MLTCKNTHAKQEQGRGSGQWGRASWLQSCRTHLFYIAGQKLATWKAFSTLLSDPSLHWFPHHEELRPASVCCLLPGAKDCFP